RQLDWLRDKKTMEFSEQRHHDHTFGTQLAYIRSLPVGSHIWGIRTADADEHIGNITAYVDEPNNIADLAVLIGERDCWGKGLATEAFKVAARWLLDPDGGGLRKVEAGCMANHTAMRRVFYHAGFEFEGERKGHFLMDGEPVGCVHYGKFL